MIQIVVSTHGGLARELVGTVALMVGTQPGLSAICLEMNEGIEDLTRKLQAVVAPAAESGGALLLVDMFGGTPSNVALMLSRQFPVQVVTGVNLPMIIEALTHRADADLPELAALVSDKGRKSIMLASDLLAGHTA